MSIDKFGRSLGNEDSKRLPYIYNNSLTKDSSGHYNAHKQRIKYVAYPTYTDDACNATYVLNKVKRCLQYTSKDEDYFNGDNKNIRNVKDPVENQDVVTKHYLENTDFISSKLESCLQFSTKNDYFDAKSKIIRNVKDPVDKQDVVTKNYLQTVIPIRLQNAYSLGNEKLQDVAYPTHPGDGVNVQYVKNNCLTYTDGDIDGKLRKIIHVLPGIRDSDVATLSNLKKAIKEYDVVVRKAFKSLGIALFPYLNRGSRSTTTEENYLDWNKIFAYEFKP